MPATKQFDPQQAVIDAMHVFWTKGYEATSLTDLLAAMGINKGSFYDTFHSKYDLYMLALEEYLTQRFATFKSSVQDCNPREAILKLLQCVKEECLSEDAGKGCFALNCALDRAPLDPKALAKMQHTFDFHQEIYREFIQQAQANNLIARAVDPTRTAKVLLGLTMAMRVYGKVKAPESTFDALYEHAASILGPIPT